MVRAERVLAYTQLETEPELYNDTPRPQGWPTNGAITFDHVSLSYTQDGPLVLSNLDVQIGAGEKVIPIQQYLLAKH